MACNLTQLLIHTNEQNFVIDLESGQVIKDYYMGNLVGNYDMKNSRFYKMDCCSYSWLYFYTIRGFKSRDVTAKRKEKLPKYQPILNDLKKQL